MKIYLVHRMPYVWTCIVVALLLFAISQAHAQANRRAVNAGGAASSFAVEVPDYAADAGFSASGTFISTNQVGTSCVEQPAPPAVYQSERYGNKFTMRSPVLAEGRLYLVRLHFAEIYWGVAGLGGVNNGAGMRKMDVTVAGRKFLSNFDIFKEAGGANRAITRQFEASSDSFGNIDIEFAASAGSIDANAKISGVEFIEIGFQSRGTNVPEGTPRGVNVGGIATGNFIADQGSANSSTAATPFTVATCSAKVPAPQEIYQSERYGNDFVVRSPGLAEGGRYLVRLHFAEIFWGVPQLSGMADGTGIRKMNVALNGQSVLSNFDIFKEARGANKAVVREFEAYSDGRGQIETRFSSSAGSTDTNAKISGIEFIQLAAGPLTPPASTKEYVWWRGVNLAGADFGESQLPGVFGKDYAYPNQSEVDYFSGKGMNIFRFPILWERVQRSLYAELDATEMGRVDQFIADTTAKGKIIVLDPHNYARYRNQIIGSSAVPAAAFADLWRRLALRYAANDKVVFGLMNEPHNMPTAQWVVAANAAIAAIRSAGANNLILVPGNRWTGAWTWESSDSDGASNATAMLDINDPIDRSWFEVHQYLDTYASGTEDICISATIGSERLKIFTKWLRDHGKKGLLGEFQSGANAQCDQALEDMVGYMENNGDVWRGWTYWAAGPWWGPNNSLEPTNGVDARQMPILSKFLPR